MKERSFCCESETITTTIKPEKLYKQKKKRLYNIYNLMIEDLSPEYGDG